MPVNANGVLYSTVTFMYRNLLYSSKLLTAKFAFDELDIFERIVGNFLNFTGMCSVYMLAKQKVKKMLLFLLYNNNYYFDIM